MECKKEEKSGDCPALELLLFCHWPLVIKKKTTINIRSKHSSLYFFQGARLVMSATKMVPRSHEGYLSASALDINSAVGVKDD